MRPLLLRGARVIDPTQGIDGAYDVLVTDGRIAAVERAGTLDAVDGAMVECCGLWVVPGLIDAHVHLRDPGFPHKETIETGLRAAAAGGFTAVAAMANTSPVNDTAAITRYMIERARETRAARLIPVSAVTKGLAGRETVDFGAMAETGARLFSDDGIPIDSEAILAQSLKEVARTGFTISLHEEDRALSGRGACHAGEISKRLGVRGVPAAAESRRIRRDLAIAIGAGTAVHIAHISTAEGLELVRAARARGAELSCEATPHHFMLEDAAFARFGPNAKMAPPLRAPADVEAIRAGLADGTIDLIASDHAPHDPRSKQMDRLGALFAGDREARRLSAEEAEILADAANGIVGLETALGLALTMVHRGVIDPSRLVTLMSANPARLLRLDSHGTLTPGARADVTVIDPECEWTVEPAQFISLSRNTPFTGMRLKGRAVITMVEGAMVYSAKAEEKQ